MQKGAFIIFFSIVITVHLLVNFYIFFRGWQGLEAAKPFRLYFTAIFWSLAMSYMLGRLLGNYGETWISKTLTLTGSYWFAIMLYFFLAVLVVDIVRVFNSFFHFLPATGTKGYLNTKLLSTIILSSFIILVVVAGTINARIIRITNLQIDIPKNGGKYRELTAVVVSDIHLGTIINQKHLEKVVEKINSLNPDIVLIPGDLTDEKIKPVSDRNLGPILTQIKSKLGVFAITGNHEYIGGASDAVKYFSKYGVQFLRDSSLLIDESFYLVGRDDREGYRFGGQKRQELSKLLTVTSPDKAILMMDHQPWHLKNIAESAVDLQLSGHTHHAQLWPLNYITQLMFGLSWGYRKIGSTHFYVTCGVGSWGPPVRTNSYPEIVNLKIRFNE